MSACIVSDNMQELQAIAKNATRNLYKKHPWLGKDEIGQQIWLIILDTLSRKTFDSAYSEDPGSKNTQLTRYLNGAIYTQFKSYPTRYAKQVTASWRHMQGLRDAEMCPDAYEALESTDMLLEDAIWECAVRECINDVLEAHPIARRCLVDEYTVARVAKDGKLRTKDVYSANRAARLAIRNSTTAQALVTEVKNI